MDPWLVRAGMLLGFAIFIISKSLKLLLPTKGDDDKEDTRDWSGGLPAELLQEIATKLTTIPDHARFRAVCSKWRTTVDCIPLTNTSFPLLVCKPSEFIPDRSNYYCYHFISIFEKRVYTIPRLPNHSFRSTTVCGSSFGYLLIISRTLAIMTLLNPFTASKIELPPLPTHQGLFFLKKKKSLKGLIYGKLVKSHDDSSSGGFSVIVAIDPLGVFCYRPGVDSTWSKIDGDNSYDTYCEDDFSIYNKKYCPLAPTEDINRTCRLVESSSGGELLKVVGSASSRIYEVFQMDTSNIQPRWVKVTSIGEDTIFLSDRSISCFRASDFGGVCRANCIYFWGQRNDDALGSRQRWSDTLGSRYRWNDTLGWFDIGEGKIEYLVCDWLPQGVSSFGTWVRPSL